MASPYGNAITSEGILGYTLAQLAAQDAADRAKMGGYIGSLIGDYGAVPTGFQDKYGIVTPQVSELARANPFSTLKQIDRQRTRARGNLRAQLAARGAIQSGEYALGENDIGYNTGLQNYQALRDIMSNVGNAYSNYADAVRGRFGDQTTAYGDAVNRLLDAGFSPQGAGVPGGAPSGGGATGGTAGVVPGTTVDKSGFTSAPVGGYASEADRQKVIQANIAAGQANPGMYVMSPQETKKYLSSSSYGPASDRLTKMVEKYGWSGYTAQPGWLNLNKRAVRTNRVARLAKP